ncbi:phosphate transport system permease protein [Litorivivens lipolytica]|uniref:Phosphate transport system permease protein PstA n=1 Tax=Litorivivens lipolytica TaxID=1524264 RepID=A0A7W4W2S0_9GAMM|nr:phosphate ABC transporter permease PstA [Litorivivens lipolytica]MBB3046093.1 phosphate transport system permease protein [Litorivivens lipolytica]
MPLEQQKRHSFYEWCRRGEPLIWINAAAVSLSAIAVIGLLILLTVRGFGHFWPADVMQANYQPPGESSKVLIGERVQKEAVPIEQLRSAGFQLETDKVFLDRELIKSGNRDVSGADFSWVLSDYLSDITYPEEIMVLERHEWGNFYGYLRGVKESGEAVATQDQSHEVLWNAFLERLERAKELHSKIEKIEKKDIGAINYRIEKLRLRERGLELDEDLSSEKREREQAEIEAERAALDAEYRVYQEELVGLYTAINRDSIIAEAMNGRQVELRLAKIVHAFKPNAMNVFDKVWFYIAKFGEFLTDEPREANTEGGIFPAIFGTVIMVLIMSIIVTPFGVVAAVYLREYARQGLMTRIIRIAVNNLAGVPSIVYGVFGLGFFIYFLGSEIDQVFFPEALPAPTFGTPGLLWASLTLALLTLPVVIVATEEGLSRIPKALREGSLALGATKAETLWRVVLPMTSPAMMTGLILAVARAAGEVAPLMLVGVVKLAPTLPVNGNFPYFHLDQKFMHLGFHIYDVGFQSPNVEAARPLVYATALLLVVIIALLNLSAVALRNHLREKYKSLEL